MTRSVKDAASFILSQDLKLSSLDPHTVKAGAAYGSRFRESYSRPDCSLLPGSQLSENRHPAGRLPILTRPRMACQSPGRRQ